VSFNNLGPPTTIAPGATQSWWFIRNGGEDFGAQYAGPNVTTPGTELVASDQGKQKNSDGTTTYYCTIRNVGSLPCLYNLQGGGFV
jgi:hypothetical protein